MAMPVERLLIQGDAIMTRINLSGVTAIFLAAVMTPAFGASNGFVRTGAAEHECAEPGDGDVELSLKTGVGPARQCQLKPRIKSSHAEAEAEAESAAPKAQVKPSAEAAVPPPPAVVHVDESNFDVEVSQYQGLMLIDFFTPMCGPCRRTSPIVDEWGEKFRGRVKVIKIDGSQSPKLVDRLGVSTVPCLILFKDGREVKRQKGEPPRELLEAWVRQVNS